MSSVVYRFMDAYKLNSGKRMLILPLIKVAFPEVVMISIVVEVVMISIVVEVVMISVVTTSDELFSDKVSIKTSSDPLFGAGSKPSKWHISG